MMKIDSGSEQINDIEVEPLSPSSSQLSREMTFKQKMDVLKGSVVNSGPSAFRSKSTFGSTLKVKPCVEGEKNIDIEKGTRFSHVKKLDKWKTYNHLGQCQRRLNVVDTFGKLMVPPGPLDYNPHAEKRSTQLSPPHWSLYSKHDYIPDDTLITPGPGSYEHPPAIIEAEPYVMRHEKMKALKATERIGPGSYSVPTSAEMTTRLFHRETCALMPQRRDPTKSREVINFNTLKIKKEKSFFVLTDKEDDDTSHLGPGAYFPLKGEPSPCLHTTPNSTLPRRKKHDHDPNSPSCKVHKFGVRRVDLSKGEDGGYPGPGHYDPDTSMFGSQPLLESGGVASRPGKPTHNTTDSEGRVKGQHANISFATKSIPYVPSLMSTVNVEVNGANKVVSGTWVTNKGEPKERAANYTSPYVVQNKKVPRIQRNVGRGTESTAQDLPYKFSGKNSVGTFFKFHS